MPQRREAAIVGLYEYPLRVNPHMSAMQIKAECAAKALADAGLTWKDVDAVYDTGGDQGIGGLCIELGGVNEGSISGTSAKFQGAAAEGDCVARRAQGAGHGRADQRALVQRDAAGQQIGPLKFGGADVQAHFYGRGHTGDDTPPAD